MEAGKGSMMAIPDMEKKSNFPRHTVQRTDTR